MNKIIGFINRSASDFLTEILQKQKKHYESFADLKPKDRKDVVLSALLILALPVLLAAVGTHLFNSTFAKLGIIILTLGSVFGGIIELFSYLFKERKRFYRRLFIILFTGMVIGGAIFGFYFGQEIEIYIENFSWQSEWSKLYFIALWGLSMVFAITGLKYSFRTANAIYRQKLKKESEILFAKKVQEDLLPEIEIENQQIHVLGKTLVPNELGGDFFDVLKISDSKYLLAVGDVSGHNFGAGLLMAMLKSALISHALHEHDIAALTKSLNQIIFQYSDARMFATFTLVEVDLKSQLFKVVSAGHPSVIVARNNQLIKSKPSGVGLGISKNAEYEIEEIYFKANDLLILYSDGLVERMTKENKRGDFEDFENLVQGLTAELPDTTKQLHYLQNSLLQYPEQLEDDATLLLLQIKNI